MINPKSVRIGNTVLYNGEEWVVSSIDEENVRLRSKGFLLFTTWDNISGVPITPEWLVSKGFETNYLPHCAEYFIGFNEVTQDYLFELKWLANPLLIDAPDLPFYRNGRHSMQFTYQIENLYFSLTETEL